MKKFTLQSNYQAVIDSPVGKLGISVSESALTHLDYLPDSEALRSSELLLAKEVEQQLRAYLVVHNYRFSLPIDFHQGTEFQQRVWCALQEIPWGERVTYKELADKLHTGARAIGNACRRNPISIVVPCHRVVAKDSLGGYSGETQGEFLDRKAWLLNHETSIFAK